MKKIILILLSGSLLFTVSCKKYLDINSDPDTPQNPDPTSVLLAMNPAMADAIQFDATSGLGNYTQMFSTRTSTDGVASWDQHGYTLFTADRGARIWRQAYFGLGKNLEYCINQGKKNGQWDVVGAAEAMKAYMFLNCTNVHGEIIWREAFDEEKLFFNYDNQDVVYAGLDSLCRDALYNLTRTDYAATATRLTVRGDYVYNGDVTKWRKFVYGLMARIYNAQINKSTYSADSVIKFCDLSFANGTDDYLIPYDASRNADANIFGTFRDNMNVNGTLGSFLRQSDYIVRLLDGRHFAGSSIPFHRDPRMRHMLCMSADSTGTTNGGYYGSLPFTGDPNSANTRRAVPVVWGDSLNANPGAGNFALPPGKFLFHNKVVFPIMTYSEIQFMKAEAALRKNDRPASYTAYRNGVNAHFDFVNRTSFPRSNNVLFTLLPINATDRNNYLNGPNVKQTAAALTLGDIMQQKFIALWGWGFVENWVDQRKYHYTDLDPTNPGQKVYSGLVMPATLFADNGGNTKYVQRIRPRYNSEYVWNTLRPAITNRADFHVIECWFSQQ